MATRAVAAARLLAVAWRPTVSIALLATFVTSATVGGMLVSRRVGFFALAGASLLAALLLGWEPPAPPREPSP